MSLKMSVLYLSKMGMIYIEIIYEMYELKKYL